MKYALLFFSFFFVFILNIDTAKAQTKCDPSMGKRCASGTVTAAPAATSGRGQVTIANCGPGADWNAAKNVCETRKAATTTAAPICGNGATRPAGMSGCCETQGNGRIVWSVGNCTSQFYCERNKGYWDSASKSCKDSPVQTTSFKCKDGSDPDPNNTDPSKACFCSAGVTVARDQDCPASSKVVDQSKCLQKVPNYSLDEDGKCICGGKDAEKFVESGGVCASKSGAVANFLKICADAGGGGEDYSEHGGPQICTCESNKAEIDPTKQKCPSVQSGEVPSCLKDFKAKADACKTDGIKAVNSCNKDNKDANAQWSAAQSVIGPMAQIMQMRGQQQGSAETCFQAGALATTTYGAMDLLKETCDNEIEACHNKCEEATAAYEKVEEICKSEVLSKPQSQQADYSAKLKQEADKINAELEKGTAACEKDAKTNQARVIDMMNGMNRSAQQAAKCQCQLTAGQTNCDQILGPADCKLTPKDPRCPQAVTVKCAGTDYNTKECICLRDPKAVSCIGTTGSGASQIAGFNPVGAGSTSFKTGGTGGTGGIGDLGSDYAGAVSSDKTQGGVDSPFSAASSGGSGGSSGGGGSDGGGGGEGGAVEPEAKTGIAGMFNQLKTGVAGLFGGGSKKTTANDGKNFGGKNGASKGVDPNQWRPVGLRGIAGGNGIGSKNSDIFKTVNNQYNNQYHTLMTLPAEGPK